SLGGTHKSKLQERFVPATKHYRRSAREVDPQISRNASYHPTQNRSLALCLSLLRKELRHSPFSCGSRTRWGTPRGPRRRTSRHALSGPGPFSQRLPDYGSRATGKPRRLGGESSTTSPGRTQGQERRPAHPPRRGSPQRHSPQSGKQGNRFRTEPLRTHGEVPRFFLARQIQSARPHGTYAGSRAQSYATFADGCQYPASRNSTLCQSPASLWQAHEFPERFAAGSATLDGLIAILDTVFMKKARQDRVPAGFYISFANRFYLRAALYSSAALSQFTTFHHASM